MLHRHFCWSYYTRRGRRGSKGKRRKEVRLCRLPHECYPTRVTFAFFLKLNTIQLLCRYAASKDRRALDPPPVTELRIYDVRDAGNGTTQETEVDYR